VQRHDIGAGRYDVKQAQAHALNGYEAVVRVFGNGNGPGMTGPFPLLRSVRFTR
jgi:hypothetical protein